MNGSVAGGEYVVGVNGPPCEVDSCTGGEPSGASVPRTTLDPVVRPLLRGRQPEDAPGRVGTGRGRGEVVLKPRTRRQADGRVGQRWPSQWSSIPSVPKNQQLFHV